MPWTRQPWGGYHAPQFRTSSKGKLLTVPRAESHLTDSDFGTPIQFGTPNQGKIFLRQRSHLAQAASWQWWIGGRVALPKPFLNPEPIESLTKTNPFEPGSVNWTLFDQQTAANCFGGSFSTFVFCHVLQGGSSCV